MQGKIQALRRMIRAFAFGKHLFGADLVSAPPAEILLVLYAAELEGRCVTGEDLAEIIRLGPSPTVRWLAVLHARGLIEPESTGTVSLEASFRITRASEERLDALIEGEAAV